MAAVAPPADQAADLLQKLSLDSQAKSFEGQDSAKKPSADSSNMANGIPSDRSVTPLLPDLMDPAVCYVPNGAYPAYYYGGLDGNDWESYTRYMNPEGVEMTPGAYGDNGSLIYHHGYGYTSYAPYSPATSPVPTLGHDGQLYGAQHYQYAAPYFHSLTPNGQYPTPAAPAKGEIATSAKADQAPLSVDSSNTKSSGIANGGVGKGNNGTATTRSTYQNSSVNANSTYGKGSLPGGIPVSGYQDPRFGFDSFQTPIPWLENQYFSGQQRPVTSSSMTSTGSSVPPSRDQNFRPHVMGLHNPRPINSAGGYMNRMYPNKLYGQYGNSYGSGLGYGSNGYDSRINGRGWMTVDSKYKTKGRGNSFYSYGYDSVDGLNELNRGPRAKGSSKNPKAFSPVALAVKGQNIPLTGVADNENKSSITLDREQYNKPDFPDTYLDAKFFVIKSYSEDDVHKSIKYNIWASTPNGNKKLDAAYNEAQQKSGGCPVFLFFSVNTSGQFVGVAEMVGPVDFNKNVEYWQQDKWVGCFPVKWHIVKDVPNSLLKHITLENNENKPVTNSRDTQEVKLEQGLQVLKIFKDHTSRQCILDDFDFYEDRQKKIQEKKAKQQLFQKQAKMWEGKPTEEKAKECKENANGDSKTNKSLEVESVETVASNGDIKTPEDNSITKAVDAVLEKKPSSNGVPSC
ncbi:evolutionarily conserved C-terminal region 2 [Striga hermonthica]|uniref:YTH domain-containing family protein n=1 Tax=Striga hermonthica TaxID=68872 RepID=A0A9N7NA10_STRHE|nr:evolutionarily conserved C-terminal region 2 [Striga hermonthica]